MFAQLVSLLGADAVLTDPADTAPYRSDLLQRYHGSALAVVRPRCTDDVSRTVGLCAANKVAITPYGGGTGFCGGAIPIPDRPHIVLSLERMRQIRSADPAGDTMVAEAGCTLAQVRQAADDINRLFPVSHGGEGTSQIGGMIATNAGGNNVVLYGMARAQILGLEVVLADGTIWNGLRALRKDNSGYDVKQLFIGSEGTLGIVTAATLALRQKPVARATALAAVAGPQEALDLYVHLRAHCAGLIAAMELIPRAGLDLHFARLPSPVEPFRDGHGWMVLIELETIIPDLDLAPLLEARLVSALERGTAHDVVIAQSETQRLAFWALREGIAEAQASNRRVLKSDTAVPVSASAAFIREATHRVGNILPGATPIPFGHLGDGNIHFNVLAPADMETEQFQGHLPALTQTIEAAALALGGTISAEHGLGQSKRASVAATKPEIDIEMMKRIKAAFDPDNRLNPGKVIEFDRAQPRS